MFVIFLLFYCFTVHAQNDTSPCPRLFVYEGKSSVPNRWYGIITLLSESELEGIWLHLIFNSQVQQIGNWFGEVQPSIGNTEFLIKNPTFVLKALSPHPIRFYAQYEQNAQIPRLTSFLVNAKTVCPEQKIVTRTTQRSVVQSSGVGQHTTNRITSLKVGNDDDDDYFLGDFSYLNRNRTEIPIEECGTVSVKPKPRNVHETTEGEYPWQANLYYASSIDLVYLCSGSLISKNVILTSAHCFYKNSQRIIFPNEITVYLGKYHLRSFSNVEIQDRTVHDIIIHPRFNSTRNNVALLKLDSPVLITDYVRPICLWQEEADLQYTIGKEGVTVGWGLDVNGRLSQQMTQTRMRIVSNLMCSTLQYGSFCAGFDTDSSICNADSGGGLFFAQKTTSGNIWQLRGIVSLNNMLQNWRKCDSSKYVMFTDVAKYVQWIKQFV